LHISQISRMAVLCVRQAMLMTFRIVMAARARGVRCRAVAILMNVKRVFLVRIQPFQISDYFNRVTFLGESYDTMAVLTGRWVKYRNGLLNSGRVSTSSAQGRTET